MTAKSGEHRTIRLPEDLVKRTDSVRGSVFRERWIRILLYRITGDLLLGARTVVLEFGAGGKLLDGPRKPIPVAKEPEPVPIPWEDDDSLPDVEQLPAPVNALAVITEAVAGQVEAEQAVRTVPPPELRGLEAVIRASANLGGVAPPPRTERQQTERPRLRLKRPEVKP